MKTLSVSEAKMKLSGLIDTINATVRIEAAFQSFFEELRNHWITIRAQEFGVRRPAIGV